MSMQSVASPAISFTPPKRNSLTHIPGDEGWPIIGKTLEVLADPKGHVERNAAKYGLVYRTHLFGETSVGCSDPRPTNSCCSIRPSCSPRPTAGASILGLLFPRGLMLLDFDEHRLHRRALSVAFKSGPMKSYLAELDTGIAARVAQWKAKPGPMLFYPAMKQLTLDLAATSFLGADIGPEVDEITRAFVDMVAAAVALIRKPLPGTQMARGVRGRKRIVAYFSEQIPIRRAKDGGDDLFSQLCRATHEDGALLSTQDIVDHMSFLMMAAHDTLTSSLTSFIGGLAAHPRWQASCATKSRRLGIAPDEPTTLRQSRSHAAVGDGVQGSAAASSRRCPRCRAARSATSPSRVMRFRPAPWSASIRCSPTTCPRSGPIPTTSIRCASPTRRSATAIASPMCRSAAARICASGCTSPICRRNALRGISCKISGLAGAGLQAGLADVADPEAARRLAGDGEAGLIPTDRHSRDGCYLDGMRGQARACRVTRQTS